MLQTQGLVVDFNVLQIYPVELEGARMEDGYAEIHLSFQVQQVAVLVDKKGELKEGSYDDIVKMSYGKTSFYV
jgi:predicted lipid-binding transport protein (Tim44 family)